MRRRITGPNLSRFTAVRCVDKVKKLIENVQCNESTNEGENKNTGPEPPTPQSLEKRATIITAEAPVITAPAPTEKTNDERLYSIVWGKPNTRKHKTWEGDGKLAVSATYWRLTDESGASLGSMRAAAEPPLEPGVRLRIGNKEVEIIEELPTGQNSVALHILMPPSKKPKLSSVESPRRIFKKGLGGTPLIFPRPTDDCQWSENTRKVCVRDVTLDSLLCRCLRPHQRDGVLFLYECVMGFRNPNYYGAILADEMGLGKTLQIIALIWTLLKQGPYGTVVCKKVLVITPSSLCANWSKEFTKWLGRERIQTYVVDKSNNALDFSRHPLVPVMIISYEQFVRSFDRVVEHEFDMIVCDEGHRLKNPSVKVALLLAQMECRRRVLLTGTPIQNCLQEYFNLIELVNPGILGSGANFRDHYESHIVAAQHPSCGDVATLLAQQKSAELNAIIGRFVLRRTQDIMENYLPCKTELIVCCVLSPLQKNMYQSIIDEWFHSEAKNPFSAIAELRKICNHPSLVDKSMDDNRSLVERSGKLRVVDSLLNNLVIEKNENIVLVSYSTKFLDILQKLCSMRRLKYLRLDGTTPVTQRKSLVEMFNSHSARIFLVSARAGGAGLNLTGASRLVLADGDWNPSNDLQALARIWRDGQRKNVTVYRLMCTGTIEEKIFQRQLWKLALGDSVEDPDNVKSTPKFSEEELKDLFTPNFNTDSITHDVIQCPCHREECNDAATECADTGRRGGEAVEVTAGVKQLMEWTHFSKPFTAELLQDIGLLGSDAAATFIFKKVTNPNFK